MLPIFAIVGGIALLGWGIKEISRRGIDAGIKELPRSQWSIAIARRDKWVCGICGKRIYRHDDLEIDHIKPRSLGGEDIPCNLRATHWWCNAQRSNTYYLGDRINKISREV
jgi:5-methylcytosine-specific restriction endonuclease McrA